MSKATRRVSSPGEHIKELIKASNITNNEFASKLDISILELEEIINGNKPITMDIANRLSNVVGNSKEFWINLQSNYDDYNKLNLFDNVELPEKSKEEMEVAEIVGALIFKLVQRRIDINMSRYDLAKASGIRESKIARIEELKTMPKIDTLIRISIALGLKIDLI